MLKGFLEERSIKICRTYPRSQGQKCWQNIFLIEDPKAEGTVGPRTKEISVPVPSCAGRESEGLQELRRLNYVLGKVEAGQVQIYLAILQIFFVKLFPSS